MAEQTPAEEVIFLAALEKASPAGRAAYVADACGDNAELRQRVEELLRCHAEPVGPLDAAPLGLVATLESPSSAERPGTTIGRYKLLQEIGEGGFGVVYMAEQREPVRRKVALKIVKPGMDTRAVVARFEAERQSLALMDHPNIAHVFDGGATDSGRSYFVMELVHGITLTEYCDQNDLTTRERLELFVQICHAVQHAHQKGIIHRDLKPSNVMVTLYDGVPVPKIIDFGVAKATGGQLTEKTAFTGYGQLIGTPLYMSPEQAEMSGLDVDTRSDIYSLGVLLYELLTGSTPFDQERLREAGYDEIRRMIREDEPPRPSTRISTLAAAATTISAHRKTEPTKLSRLLRRQLDWIVMKALEKDRTRRYQTANDFARDIERYLNDDPIEARPPTLAGRAARWARRHRPLVWASAAVLGIALLGSLASALLIAGAYEREKTRRVVAQSNEARALTGENLAKQQEELAKQQEALAKQQQSIAIQQRAEAERQRDAAERALYAADMQGAYHDRETGQTYRFERRLYAQLPKPGRPDLRGWEWYYAFSVLHGERLVLPGQFNLGWSPDGKDLATLDCIGLVNIWDVSSGKRKAPLRACPPVTPSGSVSWSPDGKHVAAATDRGTIIIWEVASGAKVRSLMGRGPAVLLIDWSPDGRRIASEDGEKTIWIWDWRTGKTLASLVGPAGPVHCLDWHPDSRQLLAVYGPRIIRELKIWDTASGREIVAWPADDGAVAAFSPDGSRLVWGMYPVRVTDLKTRKVVSSFSGLEVFRSTWSPSGDRLASTCYGGAIKIWDAASGAELRSIPARLSQTKPIAWSPTGELIGAASWGHAAVRVWDTAAARKAVIFDTPRNHARFLWVAFSPDGKRLLVSAQNELPRMYDVESGAVTVFGQHRLNWLRRADWSPDGKRFATSTYAQPPGWIVLICDAKTGEAVLPPLQCEDEPRSLAWSPDGRILAVGLGRPPAGLPQLTSGAGTGRVKLFSASTGKELAASDYAAGLCRAVAWRPDGKRLAAAGNSLRVWDSDLCPQPFAATAPSGPVDWSPDGHKIAAASEGTITIYDSAAGTPLHVLNGLPDVEVVRWHPSMPRLASGGRDGMIRIWDSSSGQELCAMDAHTIIVRDLDWSPDGWRLASAGDDGSVRIWDASPADRFLRRHGDVPYTVWKKVYKFLLFEAYEKRGNQGAMREKFQEVLDPLQGLRTLHPEEQDLQWQIQHIEWLRASQLARAGETDEAIAIFQQLTAESPDLPDYRLQLPGVVFDAGMEAQAIEMLEKTVAEFPQQPEYHEELAYLYERRAIELCLSGDLSSAVAFLRKLAKEFPERPGHRAQLVRQLTAQLPPKKAIELFRKLAQELPDASGYREAAAREQARVYRETAHQQLDRKDHGESENAFRQAIQLWEELARQTPEDFDNRFELADTYHWSYRPYRDTGRTGTPAVSRRRKRLPAVRSPSLKSWPLISQPTGHKPCNT